MKLKQLEKLVGKSLWLCEPVVSYDGPVKPAKFYLEKVDRKNGVIESDSEIKIYEGGPAKRDWLVLKYIGYGRSCQGYFFKSYWDAYAYWCKQRIRAKHGVVSTCQHTRVGQ